MLVILYMTQSLHASFSTQYQEECGGVNKHPLLTTSVSGVRPQHTETPLSLIPDHSGASSFLLICSLPEQHGQLFL